MNSTMIRVITQMNASTSRKKIKEGVKFGHLAHLVKEIKQWNTKGDHPKAVNKGETSGKDKALSIFMILVPLQWHTRKAGDKENSSHPIYSPWHVPIVEGVVTLHSSRVAPINDQLEWVLWYAPWLSDQLEWICGMLHGLVINWSSSAIETSRNRVNGEYRDDKKDVRKSD
ncbi:hypothetical protein Tco_0139359 [Tanacetum coccineum]